MHDFKNARLSLGWHAYHNSLITISQRQSTLRNLRVQKIFLEILKAEWVQDWLLNFTKVKLLFLYSGINMFNRISSLGATATKRNNFTCPMKSRDLVCRLKERAFENCDLKSCWENRILKQQDSLWCLLISSRLLIRPLLWTRLFEYYIFKMMNLNFI